MSPQRLRAWGEEMREVHRRLREALDLARESVEEEHTADPLAGNPLLYCWGFCAALNGHHRSETGHSSPAWSTSAPISLPSSCSWSRTTR